MPVKIPIGIFIKLDTQILLVQEVPKKKKTTKTLKKKEELDS
jgi:hypothetical protein